MVWRWLLNRRPTPSAQPVRSGSERDTRFEEQLVAPLETTRDTLLERKRDSKPETKPETKRETRREVRREIRRDAKRLERRSEGETRRRFLVEPMERRQLMAADPARLGVVYIEEDSGADIHGDTFEVQFEGGAPGTQLTRLVINTDQGAPGYSRGDLVFDTLHEGVGADEAFPMTVLSRNGIDSVAWKVVDGGQRLELEFTGFEAGERLVFSIDVDEIQHIDPSIDPAKNLAVFNGGVDPIASGVEFQGSTATAAFVAPHYADASGDGVFMNVYDPLFAGTDLLRTDNNSTGLPADNVDGKRDRSTGVLVAVQQAIRPASLCGAVYEDLNQNGRRDPGEPGIAGVDLRAIPVTTIDTQAAVDAVTDADGNYCFTNLTPGSYRVEEQQPDGYFDGLDRAGDVDGDPRGRAENPGDRIVEITLNGGDAGREYLFGEIPPGRLSGRVSQTDPTGDCDGPLAVPLANVEIRLFNAQGDLVASTRTGPDGRYEFTNLPPGEYSIVETTPAGMLDGDDHVGTLGGAATGDDSIRSIRLPPGGAGLNYDFCEHLPALLAGFVYHDRNDDGVFQRLETPIPGTTVELRDSSGAVVRSTVTDSLGFYAFRDLPAGVYELVEQQPLGWLDGRDSVGTIDTAAIGMLAPQGDAIREIRLKWGDIGVDYNFGERLPASISGNVSANSDDTCLDVSKATPLAGIEIELLDEQERVVATTRTDANGDYRFTGVAPGVYSVRQTQPATHFNGPVFPGNAGGDLSRENLIDNVFLGSGTSAEFYDFCELPPSRLSGFVFQDGPAILTSDGLPPANLALLRDGRRTADDTPLENVTLELRDGVTGQPLLGADALPGLYPANQPITAVTNANGFYEFAGLRGDASYAVFQQQPAELVDSIDTPGSTSGVALNRNQIVPADIIATLAVETDFDSIVRIPLGYGQESRHNNFSEVQI
ncbi:MAG: hypothetical protein RLY70_674, partial [Planctomycetota bacterium]